MPFPTSRSVLGIAKEATRGTPVAATDYIPFKSWNPFDDQQYLPDMGIRGSMVDIYDEIQGPLWSTLDWGGEVFADTFGFPLMGLLGDVTTTGASAPFSHAGAVKNSTDGQPTSYTITDANAIQTRQYPAQQIGEVSLTFSADGLLDYTAKSWGYGSVTTTAPTPSFTAVTPYAVWKGTTTIGGSSVLTPESGSVDLKRNASVIHTVDGTAGPYRVFVGPLGVTGKMSLIMEDETELTRYLTNTQPSLVFDWSQGAAAALVEVKLQMTKAAYTVGKINRGKDYVVLDVDFTAKGNTTDAGASGGYSNIKATIQSAKAANSYV